MNYTCVVGTQKNRLNAMALFKHPTHMLKLMNKKICNNILFNWTCKYMYIIVELTNKQCKII